MIVLKNKMRQPQVFNLDAPFFLKNNNETHFGQPCTLTFLALEEKEVHEAVLSCPEIKEAMSKPKKTLKVVNRQVPQENTAAPVTEDDDE